VPQEQLAERLRVTLDVQRQQLGIRQRTIGPAGWRLRVPDRGPASVVRFRRRPPCQADDPRTMTVKTCAMYLPGTLASGGSLVNQIST